MCVEVGVGTKSAACALCSEPPVAAFLPRLHCFHSLSSSLPLSLLCTHTHIPRGLCEPHCPPSACARGVRGGCYPAYPQCEGQSPESLGSCPVTEPRLGSCRSCLLFWWCPLWLLLPGLGPPTVLSCHAPLVFFNRGWLLTLR